MYSGFAQRNLFNGLEARTMYRYRIKFKGTEKETPWSRPVEVMTTKKPPSAEDLHKAVSRDDFEAVSKLLTGRNCFVILTGLNGLLFVTYRTITSLSMKS